MEGVSAAYFVYPLIPGLIDATAYFAQAAREAGPRSIVNMSQISARRESKSHEARDGARIFVSQCGAEASTYRCRSVVVFRQLPTRRSDALAQ
jgi:hypothetical protein